MASFDEQLQNLLGHHKPEEIEELVLDEFTKEIKFFSLVHKKGLELYRNLIHLSLNNIGLENLSNFPEIKSLMILSLNNNKLTGDDFSIIPNTYPLLYKLKISNNNIQSIDKLSYFSKTKLKKIEIKDNPFTKNIENYRQKVYELIPSLVIVDQKQKNGQEIDTTDYGNDSSSMGDEDYEDGDDAEVEDSDDSDVNEDESDNYEDEYNEENEDDEKNKKKKKK